MNHTLRTDATHEWGNNTFRVGNRFYNVDSHKAPGLRNKLARAFMRLIRR